MRKIINISLSESLDKKVTEAVKEGNYSTKSEFFRDLLRLWNDEKLLKEIKISQKEIAVGRGSALKSLKQLR